MAEDFFSETIGYEPEIDYENGPKVVIKNGCNPSMDNKILYDGKRCLSDISRHRIWHTF